MLRLAGVFMFQVIGCGNNENEGEMEQFSSFFETNYIPRPMCDLFHSIFQLKRCCWYFG